MDNLDNIFNDDVITVDEPKFTVKAENDTEEEISKDELIKLASNILEKQKKKEEKSIEYKYVFGYEKDLERHMHYKKDGVILFKWNDEYWEEKQEEVVKSEISQWLKAYYPSKFTNKTVSSIYQMMVHTAKQFDSIKMNEIIIPTKKHWLLVDDKTGDVTAIKPDKNKAIRHQIKLTIDKPGKYTLPDISNEFTYFNEFIKSSMPDLEKQKIIQEYAGYSFCNDVRKQTMLMFVGKGANGKSIFIEVLASVHSKAVSVRIDKVHEYNNHLIDASLIYCTETNKKGFDQEFIKQAVAGDKVELRGIYSKKQNAYITAKWIMIMNDMPRIDDYSDGMFRRVKIISWDKQFDGKNGNPKPIDNLSDLIIKNDSESFIIWCLQGLQRLIRNKWQFTESKDVEKALFDWKNSMDKVSLFVNEYNYKYFADQSKHSFKNEVFAKFNSWADENNFEQMNSTTFWNRIKNIYPEAKNEVEKKVNGKRITYLKAEPL